MKTRRREAILALAGGGLLFLLIQNGPLPQSQDYHRFADTRSWLGIPNYMNVLTNLMFLVPGILGLRHCCSRNIPGAVWSWRAFFFGSFLVAFGSGYYHWHPEDWTLLWDRLPMTICFTGLFSILLCEQVFPTTKENIILLPLLFIGLSTVFYWYVADDLRPYLWVQFFPLICMLLIPLLFTARFSHQSYLFGALILYAIAKSAETYDHELFQASGRLISGHSLKHLLAGLAVFLLLFLVQQRRNKDALNTPNGCFQPPKPIDVLQAARESSSKRP